MERADFNIFSSFISSLSLFSIKMYSRIARSIATKKMAFSLAGVAAAASYAQECKNDVIFFTKSK